MKTRKPISSISYLTPKFLTIELDKLIERNYIQFYAFINHLPEEDENKKEHMHLFIIPNDTIDTKQLDDTLVEFDSQNPLKPKRCLMWLSSKFADWYLYGKHDEKYLASKGQTRIYHYPKEEFICSDYDYFNELIHQMDMSKFNRFEFLKESVAMGKSWGEIVSNGQIPPQQYSGYKNIYETLWNYSYNELPKTFRNGKPNHEESEEDLPWEIDNAHK